MFNMSREVGLRLFRARSEEDTPGFRVGPRDTSPGVPVGLDNSTLRPFPGGSGVAALNERYTDMGSNWSLHDPTGIKAALASNPYLNAIGRLSSLRRHSYGLSNDHGRLLDDSGSNNSSSLMPEVRLAADRPEWGSNEPYRHYVCTEAAYSCLQGGPGGTKQDQWIADCLFNERKCNELLNDSRANPFTRDFIILFPNRGYVRIPAGRRGEGAYVPPPR